MIQDMSRLEEMQDMRFNKLMTLKEIGDHFGISKERVRKIIGNTGNRIIRKRTINGPGVYLIRNKTNNRAYIGSSKNVKRRLSQHFSYLKTGTHSNKTLQSDYSMVGRKSFEIKFYPLKESEIFEYESYLIDMTKPYYNFRKSPKINTKTLEKIATVFDMTLKEFF